MEPYNGMPNQSKKIMTPQDKKKGKRAVYFKPRFVLWTNGAVDAVFDHICNDRRYPHISTVC